MNYERKAREIAEKFKNQHNITGSVSEVILESISESLKQIESAKEAMRESAERKRLDATGHHYQIPYGLGVNRFGEVKQHPGIQNIKQANENIRAALKTLNVSPEVKGANEKKPKGKLKKMLGD